MLMSGFVTIAFLTTFVRTVPQWSAQTVAVSELRNGKLISIIQDHRLRFRRSTSSNEKKLSIDLLFLVDYSTYLNFLTVARNDSYSTYYSIQKYYGMVFTELARIYSRFSILGRSVNIQPVEIIIASTKESSPWIFDDLKDEIAVDAFTGLKKLKKWRKSNTGILPKHDHAIAFTKKDIIRVGDSNAQGMAFVKSICRPSSVSFVEDIGGMATIAVAAHELAHSLGASHDGAKKNKRCSIDENYMMVPSASSKKENVKNSFYLSQCSLKQIEIYLLTNRHKSRCLFTKNKNRVEFQGYSTRTMPGQQYSLHEQCKFAFGKNHRFCGETDFHVSQLCYRLWCRNTKLSRYAECFTKDYFPALEGTSCGHKMWCVDGICAEHENAPEQRGCDFGDRDGKFCEKLISQQPQACFTSSFNRFCCRTCKNMKVFGKVFVW